MPKISSIVITYNEEDNIKDCLESIKWSDEIIIVDSGSNDRTIEIARNYTDKIYNKSLSFAEKRNFGIENAACEWILWVDADERVTDELKNEIAETIPDAGTTEAFLISRKSFFINKFIKHCGWYPDYTLRLFKKSTGIRFDEKKVHEKIIYSGNTQKLKYELLHYTDKTFEHYLKKLNSYTTFSAQEMFEEGKRSSISEILFRPLFTFFKMYILQAGFLDGFMGLVLCVLSGTHVFFKYSKLYELNLKK